jgi:hypothetical protein
MFLGYVMLQLFCGYNLWYCLCNAISIIKVLYFYTSTFRSMWAVLNMTVFCKVLLLLSSLLFKCDLFSSLFSMFSFALYYCVFFLCSCAVSVIGFTCCASTSIINYYYYYYYCPSKLYHLATLTVLLWEYSSPYIQKIACS